MGKFVLSDLIDNKAVLEMNNGETFEVPCEYIPADAKKGDKLKILKDVEREIKPKRLMSEHLIQYLEGQNE